MTTRKERVLDVLTTASRHGQVRLATDTYHGSVVYTQDGWIDGHWLCTPETGGSEGLRRVRELRADGHDIEMRPHPVHGRTSRQYRLIERTTLL